MTTYNTLRKLQLLTAVAARTEFLNDYYVNPSWVHRLWHLEHNSFDIIMCKICGENPAHFHSFHGYTTCSTKCSIEQGRRTSMERYGVDSAPKLDSVRKKMQNTMIERYGVDNWAKSDRTVRIKPPKVLYDVYEVISTGNGTKTLRHTVCGVTFTISRNTFSSRKFRYQSEICTHCNPLNGRSHGEQQFFEYIKSLCAHEISQRDRVVISPLELDVYIPNLKLAFEFTGEHWHTYADVKRNDERKIITCKEKGIELHTILYNDWRYRRQSVYDRVKDIINIRYISSGLICQYVHSKAS